MPIIKFAFGKQKMRPSAPVEANSFPQEWTPR